MKKHAIQFKSFLTDSNIFSKQHKRHWQDYCRLPGEYPSKLNFRARHNDLGPLAYVSAYLCAAPTLPFYLSLQFADSAYQSLTNSKLNPVARYGIALPGFILGAIFSAVTYLPALAGITLDFAIALFSYLTQKTAQMSWHSSLRYRSGSSPIFGAYTGASIRDLNNKRLSNFSFPLTLRQNLKYGTNKISWNSRDFSFVDQIRATTNIVLAYPYLLFFGIDQAIHKADVKSNHPAFKVPMVLTTPLAWLVGLAADITMFVGDVIAFSTLDALRACVELLIDKITHSNRNEPLNAGTSLYNDHHESWLGLARKAGL